MSASSLRITIAFSPVFSSTLTPGEMDVIFAALLHDIGKLSLPKAIAAKDEPNDDEKKVIDTYVMAGDKINLLIHIPVTF